MLTQNTAKTKPWQSVNDYKLIKGLVGALEGLCKQLPTDFTDTPEPFKAYRKAQNMIVRAKKEWAI